MRERPLVAGVLALLIALAAGLAGCERAKPAPTPTGEPQPTVGTTATPASQVVMSPTPSEAAATPPPSGAETPAPPPAQATPTRAPAPAPGEGFEYVVRWGDTIYLIAARHGVSVQDIVAANNLTNPDLIRAGDVLIIPGAAAPPAQPGVHIVRQGETLNTIARMYGTTADAIARANGIVNPNLIYVGQSLTIPGGAVEPTEGQTYVVQPGDTLSSIAVRFGTTAWAIAYANDLPNVNIIYVGQTLNIP